jgi:hypothetical protein
MRSTMNFNRHTPGIAMPDILAERACRVLSLQLASILLAHFEKLVTIRNGIIHNTSIV